MDEQKSYGSTVSIERLFDSSKGDDNVEEMTIQEVIERAGFGKYQLKLIFLLCFVAMAASMELMILSILSPVLECEWGLNNMEQAALSALVFLGMFFGCPFWGMAGDKFGRKPALLAATSMIVLFGLVSALATNIIWLLLFRALAGFGMGAAPLGAAAMCEYVPLQYRGKTILFLMFFWSIGSAFEVLLAYLIMDSLGWRVFLAISALPVTVFAVLAPWWLPESSRYLFISGRTSEAKVILQRIATENGNALPPYRFVHEEMEENRGKIIDLFKREHLRTTLTTCILWFTVIFSYYGIVLFATVLYASDDECKGGSKQKHHFDISKFKCIPLVDDDYISLIWTSLAEIPGNFIAFFLVDIIGRKRTIAAGEALQAVTTVLLFMCLSHTGVTIVISIVRAMALGAFNVLYVYTPEVYPTKIRGVATGTCSAIGHIGAVLTPLVAQVSSSVSLNIPVAVYAICSVAAVVCALLLPVETRGIDSG